MLNKTITEVGTRWIKDAVHIQKKDNYLWTETATHWATYITDFLLIVQEQKEEMNQLDTTKM